MNDIFDRMIVLMVRALSLVLRLLPIEASLFLGRLVGFLLSKLNYRRRVAYANLKAAFGGRFSLRERKEIITKHFIHLAQNVVEILCFPKLDQKYLERSITVENRQRYETHVSSGRGTVLITPHFGNWELTQILSGIAGKPMYVLAREQKQSRLDDFLNELRSSHGSVSIHKGGKVRDLIRQLQNGGIAGALGDLSGGRSGTVIKFFGRKTTAPPGIFEIAKNTNAVILPCFMVRVKNSKHHVFIEEPFALSETNQGELNIQETVQNYYRLLERWISKYPDQWLWIYKRWKYCFTKKILVLKDERSGHSTQSEAIMREFERVRKSSSAEYEFEYQTIDVRFKSSWHRKLFFILAFFVQPFIQGRLGFLDLFLEKKCAEELKNTYTDIVISAGSSLVPLNLLMKQENLAKSIVIMKPSFPYQVNFFDLQIIPFHDAFSKKERVVRTMVTPSQINQDLLKISGTNLKSVASLSQNGKPKISVFIGGKTKSYHLEPKTVRAWVRELKSAAHELNFELLITTSRRTETEISDLIKEELSQDSSTKLLVIANESNIPNVVYGMLALSEVAVITEDSVSMISDAISAGKKVLVLKLGNEKLSKKHSRFHEALEQNALISFARADDFKHKLQSLNGSSAHEAIERQSESIQNALRKLL